MAGIYILCKKYQDVVNLKIFQIFEALEKNKCETKQ